MGNRAKWALVVLLVMALAGTFAWAQARDRDRDEGDRERGDRPRAERAERGDQPRAERDADRDRDDDDDEDLFDDDEDDDGPAVEVVMLRHQPVGAAMETIERLLHHDLFDEVREHVAIAANGPANAVVIVGPPPMVDRIVDVLRRLDEMTAERREIEVDRQRRMGEGKMEGERPELRFVVPGRGMMDQMRRDREDMGRGLFGGPGIGEMPDRERVRREEMEERERMERREGEERDRMAPPRLRLERPDGMAPGMAMPERMMPQMMEQFRDMMRQQSEMMEQMRQMMRDQMQRRPERERGDMDREHPDEDSDKPREGRRHI